MAVFNPLVVAAASAEAPAAAEGGDEPVEDSGISSRDGEVCGRGRGQLRVRGRGRRATEVRSPAAGPLNWK